MLQSLRTKDHTWKRASGCGPSAIFEPHAVVWAEEPGGIVALWKQRLRWARGNVQVTKMFRDVWFRPQPGSRLGSPTFGIIWFSLLLLPVFMVAASGSLIALYFLNFKLAFAAFRLLWVTNVVTYTFITALEWHHHPIQSLIHSSI